MVKGEIEFLMFFFFGLGFFLNSKSFSHLGTIRNKKIKIKH